jgi:LmbE family N-acetylglucosaminyl deacetylase
MVRPRLLAVFAHPDDESFGAGGTLAKYARHGVEVHVCTVTDGAAGSYDRNAGVESERGSLAQLRRQELACACEVLGVRLHTLDYRDSGMEGMPDNQHPDSLYQAKLEDVARDVARVIREVRPQVVITHDPGGGYAHPDHIKVHQAVWRAWDRVGEAGAFPVLRTEGLLPWQPERLYFTAIPRSLVKWFVRIMRLLRRDPRRFGQNRDVDLTQVGVEEEQIHVRLDVGPFLEIKERASACHKSQGGGGAPRMFPGFVQRRLLRYEYFVQAWPAGGGRHRDLFEGLRFIE